ncbi:hypothetical protein BDV19DRAFT_359685 [Aspergillus venezuelensis]
MSTSFLNVACSLSSQLSPPRATLTDLQRDVLPYSSAHVFSDDIERHKRPVAFSQYKIPEIGIGRLQRGQHHSEWDCVVVIPYNCLN